MLNEAPERLRGPEYVKQIDGLIGAVPPVEFEEAFYADNVQAKTLAENTALGPLRNLRKV